MIMMPVIHKVAIATVMVYVITKIIVISPLTQTKQIMMATVIGNACDDTPNGDPCANQSGDSDGDGVCDNQDNCDFTANPDQADNDGDGYR